MTDTTRLREIMVTAFYYVVQMMNATSPSITERGIDMKLRNLALAFTTTVLLPTFAYADDNIDAIHASFDRDFNREFAVKYAPATGADADPLDAINIALRTESDQADESTERDICRKPAAFKTAAASGEADPLDVIYVVLRCKKTDMTNSNLKHSLNHCKPIYCSVS